MFIMYYCLHLCVFFISLTNTIYSMYLVFRVQIKTWMFLVVFRTRVSWALQPLEVKTWYKKCYKNKQIIHREENKSPAKTFTDEKNKDLWKMTVAKKQTNTFQNFHRWRNKKYFLVPKKQQQQKHHPKLVLTCFQK